MSSDRALVVHGHFYQPPRENPWTEEVSREASAAPFHDWNARITSECYRPNAAARIVDERGSVVGIVDNYEHLSFNFGPTLLSWMERQSSDVYETVVADGAKRDGALAQAYGHLILPLCNERDLRTQIRWGLADFRHRFGRSPEGMWLPECAVNDVVLAALVEEGVGFTILAPGQADSPSPIDARRPYRWEHPAGDGRGIDLLFYDGPLSHAMAFELPSLSSSRFVDRALAAAGEAGIVTVATDGESFGHHHHYGERLLAHALAVEAPARGLRVTTAAAYLRDHPAREVVRVHESSWSCVHGVARWRDDCGCHTGGEPGWTQQWRAPLRAALDHLRDLAAAVFERRGGAALRDPWAARDAYVEVVIGATDVDAFVAEHVVGDRVEALALLESQRHAMAMYTSCGWFFNDLAGLETVQVLRYAARVMDLLRELGEDPDEEGFLHLLSRARSNVVDEGDGRQVWGRHVLPARVDADRTVAHVALVELLGEEPALPERVGAFHVETADHSHDDRGALALCAGQVALTHARTGRRSTHVYAALHLGGLEVLGATRPADAERDAAALAELRQAFRAGEPVTRLVRLIGDGFGPREFDLSWALPDAAEQIVERTAAALADRLAGAYERIYEDHRRTLVALTAAGYPLPAELRAPAELALARRFEHEVAAQAGSTDPSAYRRAVSIAQEAKANGFRIDTPRARATIERLLLEAVQHSVDGDDPAAAVERALALLNLAHDLDVRPDVDRAQELMHDALQRRPTPGLRLLGASLGLAVESLGLP